jgi:hypothetical protein
MTKQITQGLGGITLVVIVAVAALLLFASTALAAGSVSGDTATVAAGGAATVTIKGTAGTGHGIGNWTVDVAVDAGKLGVPTCTSVASGGACNVISGNVVRFAGADGSASGLTGDVTIGTIAVTAGASLTAGTCSDLTITVSAFDDEGGNALSPTATNGKVCVAAPTASPSPAPATSPVPTAFPNTGGTPGDSSISTLTWLLVAAGLIVVSGGAWALSRARREN